MVLDALSGIAQSAAKMAGDLRLLQHEGELLEPFEAEQIGSSAMAYKRNPMRAERNAGLARFVISLQANGAHTAASQWLERTLDDSANRRLTLPEAFLGTDAILVLATNVAAGLEVREEVVRRHVEAQMPFMATDRWLMLGVARGGDRQALHEVIRRHSLAVADSVSRGGVNDLLERLAADPAFRDVPAAALRAELEPAAYTGRAALQVGEFLEEFLHPLLERARPLAADTGGAEVRV
jgi:adenylosuccinate lyase